MNNKKEIIRFCLAGILVVGTDSGVYTFLIHFCSFNLAKGLSFACGGAVGYVINKYWTFQSRRRSGAEVVRYCLINVLTLGLNIYINRSVLHFLPGAVFWAFVIATVLTGLFSYVSFKWWVFQKSGH